MMTAGRLGRLLEIKGLTRLSYSLTFKKGFGRVRILRKIRGWIRYFLKETRYEEGCLVDDCPVPQL